MPDRAEGSQGTSLAARRTEKSLRSFLMERADQSLRRSIAPHLGVEVKSEIGAPLLVVLRRGLTIVWCVFRGVRDQGAALDPPRG